MTYFFHETSSSYPPRFCRGKPERTHLARLLNLNSRIFEIFRVDVSLSSSGAKIWNEMNSFLAIWKRARSRLKRQRAGKEFRGPHIRVRIWSTAPTSYRRRTRFRTTTSVYRQPRRRSDCVVIFHTDGALFYHTTIMIKKKKLYVLR